MQFDIGIIALILGLAATILGIASTLKSWRTDFQLRQIRKEELMTNIELYINYSQKKDAKSKYFVCSSIFKNIGRMNLQVDQISIEFHPKDPDLKLNYKDMKFSHGILNFSLEQLQDFNIPHLYFNFNKILGIKSEKENWGLYFDPKLKKSEEGRLLITNPYWLQGLQIASGETFLEEFILPYEGNGAIEISVTSVSYKRERRSLYETLDWYKAWQNDPAKYKELAIKELKQIAEMPWEQGIERKAENFLILLE